jgi:enediyne biosynthesis protein E4
MKRASFPFPLTIVALALVSGCSPARKATPAVPAALEGSIRLRDVYCESGVTFRPQPIKGRPLNIVDTLGHGVAMIDVDGDDLLDLLFTAPDQARLYRNKGGWRFEDVTASSGIRQRGFWQGVAAGDLDNDGDQDLYLAAKADSALYRNEGGRFVEVTGASGTAVLDLNRWNSAVEMLDYDADGLLDLYVAAYVDVGSHSGLCPNAGVVTGCGPLHYRSQKGILYRSTGGLRFKPVPIPGHGKTLGAVSADWDGDGRLELYLANDQMEGDMLRFQNGRWVEEGLIRGTAYGPDGSVQGGMGVGVGESDGDGLLDLFVTTFHQEPHSLYHNDGAHFTNVAFPSGVAAASTRLVGFGTQFVDLDRDGWPDLPVANGHPQAAIEQIDAASSYRQPSQILRNTGDGRFTDVTASAGADLSRRIVGRSLCAGDLDNDGDPDLVVGDLEGPPLLLRNDSPGAPGWLAVRLQGNPARKVNRDGRGAVVTLVAAGRKQVKSAGSGGSFFSVGDGRVQFGLGRATAVESLTVRWPGGATQRVPNPELNREIIVRQP